MARYTLKDAPHRAPWRVKDDELRALVRRGKISPDQIINQGTLDDAAKAPSLAAEVLELRSEVARLRQNSIDTWSDMNAMRNCINEHIPMPSIESDLLQGPENSIFCATVANAVVSALTAERENADRMAVAMTQAAVPLEGLTIAYNCSESSLGLCGGTWGEINNGVSHVRAALAAHMKLRGK